MPVFELSVDLAKLKANEKDAVKITDNISKGFEKIDKSASNLNKTNLKGLNSSFDGVIGKLAALYAGFVSLQKVMGYVNNGFRVSSSIEDAQISIASILSATNDISDAQGKMYTGQEKFAKSLGISETLIKEIQILALETSATFESIVQSVGGMVAPATQAGLAVEDIPAFAVKATQAMNAMQIPVQQMRTEMEALFTGNINKAQDILATNLGITGEMVRSWKEQGILVDMLNQKLEAFAYSGEAIANTWSGLRSNVQDAYDYISSQTGRGMFEGAKQSYRELLDLLISTEGELGVGEDIENITKAIEELQDYIGNQLLDVTREFIDYIKWLNQPDNLNELKQDFLSVWEVSKNIITGLSEITGVITSIAGKAVEGYNSMPEELRTIGLIGIIFGGKLGFAAVTAVSVAWGEVKGVFDEIAEYSDGIQGLLKQVEKDIAYLEQIQSEEAYTMRYTENYVEEELARLNKERDLILADIEAEKNTSTRGAISTEKESLQAQLAEWEVLISNYDMIKEKILENSALSEEDRNKQLQGLEEQHAYSLKMYDDIKKKLIEMGVLQSKEEELIINPLGDKGDDKGGGDVDTSAITKRENALKSLTSELNKLTMTDKEFESWQFNEKLKELAILLPNQVDLIGQLREAQEKAWKKEALQELKDEEEERFAEQLDFYEKFEEKTGKNTRLIELQNQAISNQVAIWKKMDIPQEFIDELERIMRVEIDTSPTTGINQGIEDWFNEATDMATQFENAYVDTMNGFVDTTWEAIKTGEGAWKDYANTVLDQIGKIMLQAGIASAMGALGIGTETSSGKKFGFGNVFESILGFFGGVLHNGGMAGQPTQFRAMSSDTIASAPRYHNGTGFNPVTETPAILLKNERVLNPQETYAYNAGMKAGGANYGIGGVNITVNNTSEVPDTEIQTTQTTNANGEIVLDNRIISVVAADMAMQGKTYQAMSSAQNRGFTR